KVEAVVLAELVDDQLGSGRRVLLVVEPATDEGSEKPHQLEAVLIQKDARREESAGIAAETQRIKAGEEEILAVGEAHPLSWDDLVGAECGVALRVSRQQWLRREPSRHHRPARWQSGERKGGVDRGLFVGTLCEDFGIDKVGGSPDRFLGE